MTRFGRIGSLHASEQVLDVLISLTFFVGYLPVARGAFRGGCSRKRLRSGNVATRIAVGGAQEKRRHPRVSLRTSDKKWVAKIRRLDGRQEDTSGMRIEAQRVTNSDTAADQGEDADQPVSGITRHRAVETPGWPHARLGTTAEVTDRHGALGRFASSTDTPGFVCNVLAEGGYAGANVALAPQAMLGCTGERARRNERQTCEVILQRWGVERSFAWRETCRRLWKNCERTLHPSLPRMVLAFLVLLFKRL